MKKKPELLAPAGDLKKLKFALHYGADAVYCGLPDFSLRAATGFDLASLKEGIDYAHSISKKVYLTLNIFAHNKHIAELPKQLKKIKELDADAIILSDSGILMLVKKALPKMPIHLSTQANTLNSAAVKFWQKQGVERIILGRETSLQDIREIHADVPTMELEVFVHGAMCMSYSGRCYLSAWLNERSANEGKCTQPCRWDYKVYIEEPQRPGQMIPVEADDQGTYVMNSKDLCLVEYLKELADAGICSFKIEGRTKSFYYVSAVTSIYRQAIGLLSSSIKVYKQKVKPLMDELLKTDNRDYTTGFLLGTEEKTRQNFKTSKVKSDWRLAGEVVKVKKEKNNKKIFFRAHNVLRLNDEVEVLTPKKILKLKVKEIFNSKDEKITQAHGGTDEIYSFVVSGESGIMEKSLIRQKVK